MKKLSKRMLSLVLSVLMIVTMLPTFVFSNPTTAEASDVPSTDYWQIIASTDFSSTTWEKGSNNKNYSTVESPTTSAGGASLGWSVTYRNDVTNMSDIVTTSGNNSGITFKENVTDGLAYLTSYNGSTANPIFNGVDNFKIDLAFSLFDTTRVGNNGLFSDNILNKRIDEAPLIKLAYDTNYKYSWNNSNSYDYEYFTQEVWGRRHLAGNNNNYDVVGVSRDNSSTVEGGEYAITTADGINPNIVADTVYHYVVYVSNGYICSYLTDSNNKLIINYAPLKIANLNNFNLTPEDITGIYLGASEFNATARYDVRNISYKSIEIYKGVDTSTYDSTRNKYLLTYFTDNNAAGETLHYAVSSDGFNYEKVNNNGKVWNAADYTDGANNTNIVSYPTGGATSSIATSLHVRDPYVLRAQDGTYYILATDLNTHPNGEDATAVYSNGSKVLVWHMNKLTDIPNTEPWVIDATEWKDEIVSTYTGADASDAVKRFWAPQAIWDPAVGKYMLYFSAGKNASTNDKTYMYYTYTSDFKTFTTPKRLIYDGTSNTIDGDITYYNGLYYMWYKREDSSNLAYAFAPNASGPYQGVKVFDETTLALEGPSVFQLGENSYGMLADAYLDNTGYAKVCTASTPYGFTASTSTNSNAASDFKYRHGCVTRITTEEYNELKTLVAGGVNYKWLGVDSQRFNWNGEHTFNDNGKANMTYKNAYCQGTMTANNGTLKFEDNVVSPAGSDQAGGGGVMLTNTDIPDIISADQYTIDFTFKLGNDTTKYQNFAPENNTIFSIYNQYKQGDNTITDRYIRLAADGTFYVNGTACSPKATVSNSSSKRYTIVHNEYSTSLLVDGEYVCGRVDSTAIPSTSTVTLGWCDGDYTYYRITGEYGPLSIVPTAISTGSENEYYDDLTDGVSSTPKTWSAKARLRNEIPDDNAIAAYDGDNVGFNNVVYASSEENVVSEKDYGDLKNYFTSPKNTVLAYDGNKTPSFPVAFGIKTWSAMFRSPEYYVHCCIMGGTKFELKGYWRGYLNWGSDYSYTASNTVLENYIDSSSSYSNNQHDNTNTPRVYFNKAFYKGSGASKDNNYLETVTDTTLSLRCSRKSTYCPYEASGPIYVINYKPIRDILAGTTKIPGSNLTATDLLNFNTNAWMYTPDSYAYALYALKMVAAINPNDTSKYNYSSDTGAAALQCGKDIKAALEAFEKVKLVKNHFNITYNMVNDDVIVKNIEAGESLSGTIPAHTATYHLNGTSKHRTGTGWEGTAPASSTVPHNPVSFTESGSDVDCTKVEYTVVDDLDEAGGIGCNGYEYDYCATCNYKYLENKRWHEHDTEWTNYDTYVEKATAEGTYTTDSKTKYASEISSIIDGVTSHDETKSASYITDKNTALASKADTYLNPLADYPSLVDHQTVRDTNNGGTGTQLYTYTSWKNFATAYDSGKEVYDNAVEAGNMDNIGMYEVNASTKVVDKTDKTDEQEEIEAKNNVTNPYFAALTAGTIDSTDLESYETYESARTVINSSLDIKKYTADGIELVTNAIDTANGQLYHKLTTAKEVEDYEAITGADYNVGDLVRDSADNVLIDSDTGAIMTQVGIINGTNKQYIRQYDVTVTLQDAAKDTDNIIKYNGDGFTNGVKTFAGNYYGDSIDIALPSGITSAYSIANWSATTYDYNNAAEGSSKASSRTGTSITKIVNGKIAIVAELSDKSSASTSPYKYNIYNAYGSIIDVMYGDTELSENTVPTVTIGSTTLEAQVLPFYTFNNWTVSKKDNTYSIKPNYTVREQYDFSATGGTVSTAKQIYDQRVTVSYNGTGDFVAWAVRTGTEGNYKYQIASYSPVYEFFACANENYVAIIADAEKGGYKVYGGDHLVASMIDGEVADVLSTAAEKNAVLNSKLASRAAFISVQNAKMYENNTKARVYMRVTQGADTTGGFGVLYRPGEGYTDSQMTVNASGVYRSAITSVLSTGQFSYTLTKAKGFTKSVTYRGYLNYDVSYTVGTNTSTINSYDYTTVTKSVKA